MIKITPAFKTFLGQGQTTYCTMWFVRWVNGTVLCYTDSSQDISYNLESFLTAESISIPAVVGSGAQTYNSKTSYTKTDVASNSDLTVDNTELDGMILAPSITEADLHAGLWDFATYVVFMVNYANLTNTMGALILRTGNMGEVTLERNTFKAELRGLTQAYSRVFGELTQPGCRAVLGDSRCKVPINPSAWILSTLYVARIHGDAFFGSVVRPTTYNGRNFICTTGGTSGLTEPSWNTTIGATTADGGAVWTAVYPRTAHGTVTGVNPDTVTIYDSSQDAPGPPGGIAITGITNANPCVVGVADASTFNTGEAITMSGIVGMPLLNANTVIQSLSGNNITLSVDTSNTAIYGTYVSGGSVIPLGEDAGWYDFGVLTFVTGLNAGLGREVATYVPGQFLMAVPFPYAVVIGDTYTVLVGCDKSMATCGTKTGGYGKFDNILNMRAEPYLPGLDMIMQVGKQTG